jgi:isoleucyl-tRNA synthetase
VGAQRAELGDRRRHRRHGGIRHSRAGRRLAAFIDDLSNWYVRRSRRRFWDGPRTPDGAAAFATLYECAKTLTQLMAPIVPFISDYVWSALRTAEDPDSVHLTSWPAADQNLVDERLSGRCARPAAGRAGPVGRAAASIQIRQPLARALVGAPGSRTCRRNCGIRSQPSSTCSRLEADEHGR